MRKIYVCMAFLFLGLFLNAQTKNDHYNFKGHQVDSFINEVYGDQAQKLVFSNKQRHETFKKLIVDRMYIIKQSDLKGKKYPKLTDSGMLDIYNKSLKHDSNFNINTFNPLKYNLDFFERSSVKVYRIDNTEYLLIIKPQPKL